ncbi:MAG: hypothetical protein WDN03_10425 [Rhizomicrobium sp.]
MQLSIENAQASFRKFVERERFSASTAYPYDEQWVLVKESLQRGVSKNVRLSAASMAARSLAAFPEWPGEALHRPPRNGAPDDRDGRAGQSAADVTFFPPFGGWVADPRRVIRDRTNDRPGRMTLTVSPSSLSFAPMLA